MTDWKMNNILSAFSSLEFIFQILQLSRANFRWKKKMFGVWLNWIHLISETYIIVSAVFVIVQATCSTSGGNIYIYFSSHFIHLFCACMFLHWTYIQKTWEVGSSCYHNNRHFRSLSGYKINFNKSEALPLGTFGNINAFSFPFRWSAEGFCYLGIHVPANLNRLLHLNVTSVVK